MERKLKLITDKLFDSVDFKTNVLGRNREDEDSILNQTDMKMLGKITQNGTESTSNETVIKSKTAPTKGDEQ